MELTSYIKTVAQNEIKNTPMLKRVKGVVQSIDVENETATIILNGAPDAPQKTVTLTCASNSEIAVNSVVWVYYWKNIKDGYVLSVKDYGVGRFYDNAKTSEIFNDYSGNGIFLSGTATQSNSYSTFMGYRQKINASGNTPLTVSYNYMQGNNNQINFNSYGSSVRCRRAFMTGFNNKFYLSSHYDNNFVAGAGNYTGASTTNLSYMGSIENCTIIGNSNSFYTASTNHDSVRIIGDNNTVQTYNTANVYMLSYWARFQRNKTTPNGTFVPSFMIGHWPVLNPGTIISNTEWTSIAFGAGIFSGSNPVNAMTIMHSGDVNVYGTVNSNTGADYAEYEEWQDGNPNNEDRRGLFVTEVDNYIRIANSNDTAEQVLGIVSTTPSVCGDAHGLNWRGQFKKDIFGNSIYEDVRRTDKNGEETVSTELVQNEAFDETQVYVPRSARQEFTPIAYVGKVIAVDDGTCEVNGYCKPSDGGIATKSAEQTRFRVRERLDDTHILLRIL